MKKAMILALSLLSFGYYLANAMDEQKEPEPIAAVVKTYDFQTYKKRALILTEEGQTVPGDILEKAEALGHAMNPKSSSRTNLFYGLDILSHRIKGYACCVFFPADQTQSLHGLLNIIPQDQAPDGETFEQNKAVLANYGASIAERLKNEYRVEQVKITFGQP